MLDHSDAPVFIAVALLLGGASFGLCALLCALARRWALSFGFMDRPGGHKGHKAPVPLGGGVAIWLTTVTMLGLGLLAVYVLGPAALPHAIARHVSGMASRMGELLVLFTLATVIMAMGLLDDRLILDWRPRLAIQIGCALVLAAVGIRVTLFGPFVHPVLGAVVTVFWIVGLTNAFNMLDNMDGLAASVGLVAAILFCGAQVAVGSLFVPAVLVVVAGALLGFLVHNHAPARLYMGDAGSNFLGFLLGALTVAGTFTRDQRGGSYSPYGVLAPLLVMAVPLYDMASVIIIRLREGRSPFVGDRRHFSHRLVERGLSPSQAVLTIDLVTLAGGLGALLLHRLDAVGAFVVMLQTCCLLGVVAILELSTGKTERVDVQTRREAVGATEADAEPKALLGRGAGTRIG
jgi:UDP-GlcNAc:undecaprenyl-phosphate/decaprenyl-phosphate GlcNAc-1-phosphate transferase